MTLHIWLTRAVAIAIATAALPLFSINAEAQIAVSSNDGKIVYVGSCLPLSARNGSKADVPFAY